MADKQFDDPKQQAEAATRERDARGKQEQDALKDKVQRPAPDSMPNDANPARPQDPEPDDMQSPKSFTPQGDAAPLDPLLSPQAQQPFESYADYLKRTGQPKPEPGVYDKTVTRGEEPK